VAELQDAVSILDAVAEADHSNVSWQRDAAEAHHARGEARLKSNDVAGAQTDADAARRIAELLVAKNPDDGDAARILSLAFLLTGEIQARRGEVAGARKSWQHALATIESLARDSHDHRLLEPWTRALVLLGRRAEAAPVLARLDSTGYRSTSLSEAVRGTTPQQPVHAR
jgi:eukaryotic-like serine/threonine-protein kinase